MYNLQEGKEMAERAGGGVCRPSHSRGGPECGGAAQLVAGQRAAAEEVFQHLRGEVPGDEPLREAQGDER